MRVVDGLFMQGVELMLAGIGSVFVFLVLLVIVTRVMSWLCTVPPKRPFEPGFQGSPCSHINCR